MCDSDGSDGSVLGADCDCWFDAVMLAGLLGEPEDGGWQNSSKRSAW